MATYAWIIDEDRLPFPSAKPGTNDNAVGMTGPRGTSDEQIARLQAGEGHKFRMTDDEAVVYTGRLLGDRNSEDGFGPLDDFGTPNYGCTSIEYFTEKGWEEL